MGTATDDRDFDGASKAPRRAELGVYLAILATLLAGFGLLTFLAVSSGSPSDVRQRPVALTTLATIAGPFTGAIARDGQSCCLDVSRTLAVYLAPFLAAGLLAPALIPAPTSGGRALRLALWTAGWFVWLAGGPVSMLHALN